MKMMPCDCCSGPQAITPVPEANRPGLRALRYRVGTYGELFETMQARLSSTDYAALAGLRTREKSDFAIALLDAWAVLGDVLSFYQERIANEGYLRTATERRSILELARLVGYALRPGVASSVYLAYTIEKDSAPVQIPPGTRSNTVPGPGEQMQAFETADPLEARVEWNTLAPRLTRPQTQESILTSGLYLKGSGLNLKINDPFLIDFGEGRRLWRIAKVDVDTANDRTRVQVVEEPKSSAGMLRTFAAQYGVPAEFGVRPTLAATKRVLNILGEVGARANVSTMDAADHLDRVALPALKEELSSASGNTRKWLESMVNDLRDIRSQLADPPAPSGVGTQKVQVLKTITERLSVPSSLLPRDSSQLVRSTDQAMGPGSDTTAQLLTTLNPALQDGLYPAWQSVPPSEQPQITVHALRVSAAPFGHNAGLRLKDYTIQTRVPLPKMEEWEIKNPWNTPADSSNGSPGVSRAPPDSHGTDASAKAQVTPEFHEPAKLFLDADYDIASDTYVVIQTMGRPTIITQPSPTNGIVHRSLAAYGLSGKSVLINLDKPWFQNVDTEPFTTVRTTQVYAHSEKLELAEEPVRDDVGGAEIELGALYGGLEAGRWLIITGERTDIKDAQGQPILGVKAAELMMLNGVSQVIAQTVKKTDLPGDTVHTVIHIANISGGTRGLAYTYKRDTVTIYGNVVRATNGETREEVLGGGDATQAMQRFTLKQFPLTYVSAPTVSGVGSTLQVRVNDVQWHEIESLANSEPNGRNYITRREDDEKTTIIFGNGVTGARLPTGQENIKATYRNGIGKQGNVRGRRISLVVTRPLGVKDVINPLRASGGADRDTRDQARKNVSLALTALDRLVSVQDYEDFARTFAGIGKASAVQLSTFRRVVHVTIAGVDDIPIDVSSDLYRNLGEALGRFGDPHLPFQVSVREHLALVISARVRMAPDYSWVLQEPKIRAALLEAFSFDNRELAQDALLADAIKVIQHVPGVAYVDIDVFDAISEKQAKETFINQGGVKPKARDRIAVSPASVIGSDRQISPAQIAYLSPDVPDTLILQELKS